MRYCIIFALIFAISAHADRVLEEVAANTLLQPISVEEHAAKSNVKPNSLLDVADVGGEQAGDAERVARSYGWGGYGGYGGYGHRYGGYGGYGGYGYKRWGGYGYRPYWGYRKPYYYGHGYWG
ncbi:protein suex-1-like [Anastrepha obliqua]|uniref:protein suex-1-like n=1 Tax=Anastrepha obliqua TaxID=95512 RepID=UPI00240A3BB5|nr:protein suex-1-like [Anastrepha obliqua]